MPFATPKVLALYKDGVKVGTSPSRTVGAFPGKAPLTAGWVASEAAAAGLDFSLREDVNEAILFHGTTKAEGIDTRGNSRSVITPHHAREGGSQRVGAPGRVASPQGQECR